MSHHGAIVLVPTETEDVNAHIERMLAPYNWNLEVAEWRETCECIRGKAEGWARRELERREGDHAEFRAKYDAQLAENDWAVDSAEAHKLWRDTSGARQVLQCRLRRAREAEEGPAPLCVECYGTGKVWTTRNPTENCHLDWWRVGGRWDGWAVGDHVRGLNFDEKHETLERNSALAKDILAMVGADGDLPMAVVTPGGKYHSEGESHRDTFDENWDQTARVLLREHAECLAVVCDLHS